MKSVRVIGLAIAVLLLAACSGNVKKESTYTISASDVTEISIAPLDTAKYSRVIALANGSAEIIVALGSKKILVGRDIASTSANLASVPVVTSGHQVIPEKIIALHPDLVIVDASTGPRNALATLRAAHIEVFTVAEAWTLADITPRITAIAKVLGIGQSARALNSKIALALARSHAMTQNHPRVAFLYLRGTSAIYLMGGPGSGADSLIAAIGGIDVGATTLQNPFNSLTSEALAGAQPDILLVMSKGLESVGGVTGLLALPGVAQTPAGKFGRVIDVDDSLLLSFGPRTPALVAALAHAVASVMQR